MGMIVAAGVGCRKGCAAQEIVDLVRIAMERAGRPMEDLSGLFAPAFKHGETGVGEAARALGVPLVLIPEADDEGGGAARRHDGPRGWSR